MTRANHRPRLGLRLRVWLREHELDEALAGGTDPAATDELSLRAEQLVDRVGPARLADAVEELVDLGDRHVVLANSEAFWAATSPYVDLDAIQTSSKSLMRLVSRLREDRPVQVQGLAKTRRLLRDDGGPLYRRGASSSLDDAVRTVLCALDSFPARDASGGEIAEPVRVARGTG